MQVNLIFGILFSIIVMIFVIVFGMGQFSNLFSIQNDAKFFNQINDFDESIGKLAQMSMGAAQKFDFNVPGNIQKVCFIDSDNPESNPSGGWVLDNIMETIISRTGNNIIFYEDEYNYDGKNIDHLAPDENFCITKSSVLWIENKGDYVSVSE